MKNSSTHLDTRLTMAPTQGTRQTTITMIQIPCTTIIITITTTQAIAITTTIHPATSTIAIQRVLTTK